MEIKIDLPLIIYILICIVFLYQAIKERDSVSGGYFGEVFEYFIKCFWIVMIIITTAIFGGIYWW